MKTPPEKPTVTATTKVRLTFRGQTFDMDMAELEDLWERIGKVVKAAKPEVIIKHVPAPEPRRPFYPPQWLQDQAQRRGTGGPPLDPLEITCGQWDLEDGRALM